MELDFTRLNTIRSISDFSELQKQPTEPQTELDAPEPRQKENPAQGQIEGLQGIPVLQRQADANRAEKERALEVYREYQQNTKLSGQLKTEILKGARAGTDVYTLFLKAVKAVSIMTHDSLFYTQLEGDVRAIYGAGLQQSQPLKIELEQVQGRLQKLREAEARTGETPDSKQRINSAIRAHEAREAELIKMIEKATGGESLTA